MQDDDLFEVMPALDADPSDHSPTLKLRTDLLDQLRAGSVPGHDDLSSALALTRLARAELEAFGTGGGEKLRDAEIALAQRIVRAVLQRLGIELTPPWRDFAGFRSYWLKNNASGSYQARRDLIEQFFGPVQDALDEREDVEIRAVLAGAVSWRTGPRFARLYPSEKLSHAAIARRLGLSRNTVAKRSTGNLPDIDGRTVRK